MIDCRSSTGHSLTVSSWQALHGLVSTRGHDLGRPGDDQATGSRFAETWDMDVGHSTFAQFQLFGAGHRPAVTSHQLVRFEYSTDSGRHWRLVLPRCHGRRDRRPCLVPSSHYDLTGADNATRITVPLPPETM